MEREGAPARGSLPDTAPQAEETLPRQFGKYTLLRKLAVGGMAEVFLALHRSVANFEKLVVIKRILPQMNENSGFIQMLLHEARIAASLSHPNVVQTFDVGQIDGKYFIAMEHVHGEDIRAVVRAMRKKRVQDFPLEHALTIVMGVCSGLAYAHEKRGLDGKLLRIVHRDISPQNIVVTFTGDVKVVDFGVAKSAHAKDEEHGTHLKGKVPYMSPEQAVGGTIDHRSDIFAAGVILFELTTGRRLFRGGNEFETLRLITDGTYPTPTAIAPGYPPALDAIVMRALAKDPNERYSSAREMLADLEGFVREERIPVSMVSLSTFMRELFEETLAEQSEVLSDAKQRADEIVSESATPSPSVGLDLSNQPSGTVTSGSSGTAASGAAATISSTPPTKGWGNYWIPVLLFSGVVAGLAYFLGVSRRAAPVAVVSTAPKEPSVAPPPLKRGTLRVTSLPEGAAIWINGELLGKTTPGAVENLPLGAPIQLKVTLDGFESQRETIHFSEEVTEKSITVELKSGTVTVELDIEPAAQIWVDGKPWLGDARKITGLSAGEEHKVVVSASGHAPRTFTFTGARGDTKKFQAALVKTEDPTPAAGLGMIKVNSKGGACIVTISGVDRGAAPADATLPPGIARVSCKPERGAVLTQSVKVEAGKTATLTFTIPPQN